jgi:anthranilate synthase component 2
MRILLLDNYDSFTFNLLHLVEKISPNVVDVYKNDVIDLAAVDAYDKILLSPGPGLPKDAGVMPALLQRYASTKSIFGICLGMQAIAEHYGSKLRNLNTVCHGLALPCFPKQANDLFLNCPNEFPVGRYHSWVVDEHHLSPNLRVTATDHQGLIMALQHQSDNVCGVQFHPESILSSYGETIMCNWLNA